MMAFKMGNAKSSAMCHTTANNTPDFTNILLTSQLYRRPSSPLCDRAITAQKRQSPCLCKRMDITPPMQTNKTLSTALNQQDQWGLTPLHLACELGHADVVHILLHFGVLPNFRSSVNHGCTTPLLIAASGGHADCVQLLIQFGADVNETDCWGNSALYKAACYNFVDCVEILLENGANTNQMNKWGALPLQYASLQGYDEVVALLLQYGADVKLWGEQTEPRALTSAAIRGHVKCVELLLNYGTPVDMPGDNNGYTPLEALVHFGCDHADCLKLLLERGAVVTPRAVSLLTKTNNGHWLSKYRFIFLETMLRAIPSVSGCELELLELFTSLTQTSRFTNSKSIHTQKLILDLGLTLVLADIKKIEDDPKTDKSIVDAEQLKGVCYNANSLAALCRVKVRETVGVPVQHKVERLPIPGVVKDYLKMLP